MKDIRNKEKMVMDEFNSIVLLDREGMPSAIPVLFGDKERVEQSMYAKMEKVDDQWQNDIDSIRLPIIGLNTTVIGNYHFVMQGIVYSLWRSDLNQIVEQIQNTVTLNDKITVSDFFISNKGTGQEIKIMTAEFILKFQE